MTHLPKILPWVAKKSGISDELATKLWRRASGETVGLLGRAETSELHKRSVERFLDLVQEEAVIAPGAVVTPADFAWVLRYQSRMTFLSLLAVENTSRAFRNSWSNLMHPHGTQASKRYVAQSCNG
ncbi:MAG: hypothetical protein RIR18_511 [Pseudomonadota bacterium]|jgi:hypothetical protein